ncbi:hypothetical protein KR093_009126, partial [Drosophila rubida]
AALLGLEALPTDVVTHAPPDVAIVEARGHKQEQHALDVEEDLDGRSAYVNNQFVPNEPVELLDDEQNAPLYEILQKQMEQVLAATGPDVPIYEDDKSKRQRPQQPPNKPLFNSNHEAEADDDYVDETAPESEAGYGDAEKPDAATAEEQQPEAGYQQPSITSSSVRPTDSTTLKPPHSGSSSTRRPQRRRTTTPLPRTTRAKTDAPAKLTATTPSPELASSTAAPASAGSSHKPRPNVSSNHTTNTKNTPQLSASSNSLPHDPQIYQHKRRIIFKTISTGSQFVNSPIGDLMIKFSIGFAKPAQAAATPSSEMLRAFSNSLLRNIELQKLKRIKMQRD